MKSRFIRIMVLLLTVSMIAAVAAGCSGTTETDVTDETVSGTDTAAETETGAESVTDEEGTVTEPHPETETETETETEAVIETETDTEPVTETETETVTETEKETQTETATETERVTDAPETTAPVTETEPVTEAPVPKTDAPVVLQTATIGAGRVLLYGTAEPDCVIRTSVNGSEMKNKCKNKYFYIEVGASGPADVYLYAKADGKSESDAAKVSIDPSGAPESVWGGKDSRLFYMETLGFLTGNRADSGSLDQLAGYIANKTIKEIQNVTGKQTKLIYAVIPDPATAYYDEHFKYVQDYVLNPSTSAMMSFTNKINGIHKDVYAVDLFSAMRAHKDEDIYFTTDTHYTELGAYYAYLEIMNAVKKDFPSVKIRSVKDGDYKIEYIDVEGGDLCGMTGVSMREVVPFFVANFSDTGSYYNSKRNDGIKSAGFSPSSWERNSELKSSSNPTAYFIADSYGCYILPFIGANFSKVWTNEGVLWNFELDKAILEQNKPDYVIILVCQRNVSPNFMDSENRIRIASMGVQGF